MKVEDKFMISEHHSIEWGTSTHESNDDFSIRNRYDVNGRFNRLGSAEIYFSDFNIMINESLKRKLFSKKEIQEILKNIADFYIKK